MRNQDGGPLTASMTRRSGDRRRSDSAPRRAISGERAAGGRRPAGEEGADAIGCPPDFLAVPMLAVAAGDHRPVGQLATQARLLRFGPTLYVASIGPPSDGKTPALKAAARGVRDISDRLAAEHAASDGTMEARQRRRPEVRPGRPRPSPGGSTSTMRRSKCCP